MIITLLIFLLILSVLVLIHEFGHFIVAKKLGIKVEEFGFGFPPRAFSFRKGETLYSINWLPIGGFVKLYGEDEAGSGKVQLKVHPDLIGTKLKVKDEGRAFFSRPVWQRVLVVIAGVVMNFFLAALIYYAFLAISNFKTELPLLGEHKFFFVNQINKSQVAIGEVSKNSPAEKSGIKAPSAVISVNNRTVDSAENFISIVNKNKGKEITIVLENLRTLKNYNVKVVPRVSPPKGEGALGIALSGAEFAELRYETKMQKLFSGFVHPSNLIVYNIDVLGKLIGASVKERNIEPVGKNVTGPLGIFVLVGKVLEIPDLKERILTVLNLTGLISVTLAFFNILPIPALDGGRLFFILTEGIIGKKISSRYESFIHTIFLALLLGLIFVITIKDFPMFIDFILGR
ncbi:MAG: M50 family metallopeptidase [Candidatus Levybacteria bacterium]|nr:M50 family metallopeptidase [Candidatus Levybacteria bacterium]